MTFSLLTTDDLTLRFFREDDEAARDFVFELPEHWWSRPFEYAWVSRFVEPEHVALDAACGISHPFKFYLSAKCREAHAFDSDPRIASLEAVIQEVRDDVSPEAARRLDPRTLERLHRRVAGLGEPTYPSDTFDRIFCISVLEELPDFTNRLARAFPRAMSRIVHLLPGGLILDSLSEFQRQLKPDGLIVLTFDYPTISLDYLFQAAARAGLVPAGEVSRSVPDRAIHHEEWELWCYRAVFRRGS